MHRLNFTLACLAFTASCWAQVPTGARPDTPPPLPEDLELIANIQYSQYPETVLDIVRPKAASREKRPGVLVIHGGGWTGGTKEQRLHPVAVRWARKGFVAANVEYRLAKSAPAPAAVTDVLNAARWFRRNAGKYNVAANRIVVTGDSAGGHLSLMVGMTPKSADLGPTVRVAAVINFYGITDVADQLDGPNMRKYAVTWLPEQPGRFDLARRVSPMTYVRKDVPAILTIHGDADQTVPYEHGVQLTRAVREAGGDAEMISVPQGAHGFPLEKVDELYEHIWAFLKVRRIM
ncbi:MAG: alpha/beta hydrolase [Bryobacteraceae bacterium]